MDEQKRIMMIKEIEHWRRSKLLPEHYCDFLLNLYMETGSDRSRSMIGLSKKDIAGSHWSRWMLVVAAVTALLLSLLNFNSFGISLQIGVSLVFVVSCYWIAFRSREETPVRARLFGGLASMALLGGGAWILGDNGWSEDWMFIALVAGSALVWLAVGWSGPFGFLQYCGWMGLMFAYGWMLNGRLAAGSWYMPQLGWLPVSFLLLWVGWLFHHRWKTAGLMMMAAGATVWFAPEAFSLLQGSVPTGVTEIALVCKLAAAGLVLFAFRKTWTEWIA